jgi:hypothetical protein
VLSVQTSRPEVAPDLTKAKAHWVSRDTIAWPADALPAGASPGRMRWRLHWSPEGGLAVDEEAVTGGRSAALRYDPRGLPGDVTERFPHLKGYLALTLPRRLARHAREVLRGQLAVGQYDDLGRVADATGVQVPGVLDDLYGRAAGRSLGVSWRGARPSFALWAPTALDVDLLVWPARAAAGDPRRVPMKQTKDGVWQVKGARRWRGAQYLYAVTVYAPSTRRVERNQVTDPYSQALTTNSGRSVVVDLARDRSLRPTGWRRTPAPRSPTRFSLRASGRRSPPQPRATARP